MNKCKSFLLYLCCFFNCIVKAETATTYDQKDAYKYAMEAIKKEYEIPQKIKFIQKQTHNILENNTNELTANFSSFMIGSITQFAISKELKFKGKNFLFSDSYQLQLSPKLLELKLEGGFPLIHEKCKYWLLGGTENLSAGIVLPFDL